MPRPHSGFAKRQKELARSEKRKAKLARRQGAKDAGAAPGDEQAAEPGEPAPSGEDRQEGQEGD